MADQQSIERLRRSVPEWNEWHQAAGNDLLDLSDTDLSAREFPYMSRSVDDPYDGYLSGIDLSHTDLSGSRLVDLCIMDADFSFANLQGTLLCGSRLVRVKLRGANLYGADLTGVVVIDCDLDDALCGTALAS
jgi:uncharacterized protein YjbI with pentapeptide repeats